MCNVLRGFSWTNETNDKNMTFDIRVMFLPDISYLYFCFILSCHVYYIFIHIHELTFDPLTQCLLANSVITLLYLVSCNATYIV